MFHGAGIFTYKTGPFWGFYVVKYSSTIEHLGNVVTLMCKNDLDAVGFYMAGWAEEIHPGGLKYRKFVYLKDCSLQLQSLVYLNVINYCS